MAVEVCATQGPRPPAQVPSAYQASDVLLGGAGWWEVTQGVRSRLPRLLRAGCAASGESVQDSAGAGGIAHTHPCAGKPDAGASVVKPSGRGGRQAGGSRWAVSEPFGRSSVSVGNLRGSFFKLLELHCTRD